MSSIQFKFNPEKTAAAIIYLAQRVKHPTFMGLAKLLYFTDKTSLETYGYSLTGDTYYAMQHGPVPTGAYDMMKASKDTDAYGFRAEYERTIVPIRDNGLVILSEADVESLDQVVSVYGNYPVWQLRELSHDEAWLKTWTKAGGMGSTKMPMEDIISLIDEEGELLEYLQEMHKPDPD